MWSMRLEANVLPTNVFSKCFMVPILQHSSKQHILDIYFFVNVLKNSKMQRISIIFHPFQERLLWAGKWELGWLDFNPSFFPGCYFSLQPPSSPSFHTSDRIQMPLDVMLLGAQRRALLPAAPAAWLPQAEGMLPVSTGIVLPHCSTGCVLTSMSLSAEDGEQAERGSLWGLWVPRGRGTAIHLASSTGCAAPAVPECCHRTDACFLGTL